LPNHPGHILSITNQHHFLAPCSTSIFYSSVNGKESISTKLVMWGAHQKCRWIEKQVSWRWIAAIRTPLNKHEQRAHGENRDCNPIRPRCHQLLAIPFGTGLFYIKYIYIYMWFFFSQINGGILVLSLRGTLIIF
jgi:hypothetical protein